MRQSRLVAAAVISVYLVLIGPHIATPFVDDETWEFYASETLLSQGRALTVEGDQNVFHPHGYYYVVAAAFSLFGVNEVAARLVGIVFTIGTFLILLQIARSLRRESDDTTTDGSWGREGGNGARGRESPGRRASGRTTGRELRTPLPPGLVALIGGFHLLTPLVVQGSLIITADTAIHHFALALFVLSAIRLYPYDGRGLTILAVLFGACLWIKIVSPVLLVGSIVLFVAMARGFRPACHAAFVVGVGGLTLFFATWVAYCSVIGESSLTAFEYLAGTAESRIQVASLAAKAVWVIRQVTVVLWWVGLPAAALLLYSVARFRKWQASLSPAAGLLIVVALVSATFYTLIAGATYGFPRYHVVLAPFAALIIAFTAHRAFAERSISWGLGITVVGLAAIARWATGDPILAATFDLKLAFLDWPQLGTANLVAIATTLAIASLPFVAIVAAGSVARHRVPTVALLTCVALGTAAGQHALQRSAEHHVGLSYGEHGTNQLYDHIRSRLEPEQSVVASKDIVHHTAHFGFMPDWHWEDRAILLRRLKSPRAQFFVLGVHHNTLAQLLRTRDDEEFRTLLATQYTPSQIGSYLVWERRTDYTLQALRIAVDGH